MKSRIISDNDQDRAACRQWFAEATEAAKMTVWMAMQLHHDDPVSEIVSRFAQLAFAEMFVEMEQAI